MEQETLIELTEDDLNQIVGGTGHASLSFSNTALSLSSASVFASIFQHTTPTSATQFVFATSSSS
jgi:bacteriocin-like protein